MNTLKRIAVGLIAGGAMVVAGGGVALASTAQSGHPIDGTCYEDGSWFVSSNVRTTSGSSISASFGTLPSMGLVFGANNYDTGAQLGGTIIAPPTGEQTIASGLGGGTKFVNKFRLQTAGHQDNYSFNGSENY
jgi:hypothetical protein